MSQGSRPSGDRGKGVRSRLNVRNEQGGRRREHQGASSTHKTRTAAAQVGSVKIQPRLQGCTCQDGQN